LTRLRFKNGGNNHETHHCTDPDSPGPASENANACPETLQW
jgi:hypothetical protein